MAESLPSEVNLLAVDIMGAPIAPDQDAQSVEISPADSAAPINPLTIDYK